MKRALAVALLTAVLARPAAAALNCPEGALDKDGKGAVLLFSAIPLGDTPFGRSWDKARPELLKEFPGLRVEKTENLHITLAFMGVGWDPAKLDEMERLGLEGPDASSGPVILRSLPDLFSPQKHIVALNLGPVPNEWDERLIAKRDEMTAAGLRKRDRFDGVFKAHISLASAPKPDEQRAELARFRKWLASNAKRFGGPELVLDGSAKPAYFVVLGKDEATRFVPLREYCQASAPKK